MPQTNPIEIIRPQDLTSEDEALWAAFLAQRPDLHGPYFNLRYVKAIGGDVPHAGVARIRQDGQVAGYFAYQVRSGTLQPLGAPLSDYHGVVGKPGMTVDFDALLRAAGARHLEFQGWVGNMSGKAPGMKLTRRVADASLGFDHWWATQDGTHHKFFKNISRCQRNVEKDFGGFEFSWERVTPHLLNWVLDIKREQYRRSGMHDVFDCGWTRTLLDNLAAYEDEQFGLRAGVYRNDGRIVAAEISLTDGQDVHLWFPAYDPYYYRYSVGILLTVAIIRHMASQGYKRFDFGTGGEDYKSPLTTDGGACLEGEYTQHPMFISSLINVAAKALPVAEAEFEAARLSLRRRLKLIRATELGMTGWGRALFSLSQRAVMRLTDKAA